MGLFNKLGGMLGTTKELNVEDYMASAEMENVDIMNEPADFYVKPVVLQQESDAALIQDELKRKNIILVNTAEMAKRPETCKRIVGVLKEFVEKINGDIAVLEGGKMVLLTPAKVKIIKRKHAAGPQK